MNYQGVIAMIEPRVVDVFLHDPSATASGIIRERFIVSI
jgi:hypothetical protein